MKACKRIEIVIEQNQVASLTEALDKLGAPGYTVIPTARGRGDRGTRSGDEITGVLTNSIIIIACADDVAEKIMSAVRPAIRRSGGICLVSDAYWLRH